MPLPFTSIMRNASRGNLDRAQLQRSSDEHRNSTTLAAQIHSSSCFLHVQSFILASSLLFVALTALLPCLFYTVTSRLNFARCHSLSEVNVRLVSCKHSQPRTEESTAYDAPAWNVYKGAAFRLTYKHPMTRLCPAYDLHLSIKLRHGA